MSMSYIPMMVVGIGGIGCSIADGVSGMLSPEDKKHVSCIGIDMNPTDLSGFHNIIPISLADSRPVRDILMKHPEAEEWFPANRLSRTMMPEPHGQVRSVARLLALEAEKEGRFAVIHEEIRRVQAAAKASGSEEVYGNGFHVYICGTLSGGVSSGLFLQMPFYIRKVLKEEFEIQNATIRGMFMNADILHPFQPSKTLSDMVMANAYACMKELNAFYMTQVLEDKENHLQLEYYQPAKREDPTFDSDDFLFDSEEVSGVYAPGDKTSLPYDTFFLIEGSDNLGGMGIMSLPDIENRISKMLFTMLMLPVKTAIESLSDFRPLDICDGAGMNRYGSAGLCTIRYPFEQLRDYAALRWEKDLADQEWLLLDRMYESRVKDAGRRLKTDPYAKIPSLAETYVRLFEEETQGKEESHLVRLRQDAFLKSHRSGIESVNKADVYLRRIENAAKCRLSHAADVSSAVCACRPDMKMIKNMDTAEAEAWRLYEELEKLKDVIYTEIRKNRRAIAEEIFPVGEAAWNFSGKGELSVEKFLAGVHPVAARYLCYKMVANLDEKIRRLESCVTAADLEAYLEEDFCYKENGIQNAAEAIELIRSKRILPVSRRKALEQVIGRFLLLVDCQVNTLVEYGENCILLDNYRLLRDWFALLAHYYEEFFRNISRLAGRKEERVTSLENAFSDARADEIYVDASPEAIREMYDRLRRKLEYSMPEEAEKTIFRCLFQVTSRALEDKEFPVSEEEGKKREDKISGQLADLYERTMAEALKKQVIVQGQGILDRNVKQALEKEVERRTGLCPEIDRQEFEKARIAYEKELVEKALIMAEPMLATCSTEPLTQLVYMTMHPENAEEDMGSPSKWETEKRLELYHNAAADFRPVQVLLDPEFSRYEMVCMKIRSDFRVEDLVKFRRESCFAAAYNERIRNMDPEPDMTGPGIPMPVYTPHLNRYWHEEGFLPELGVKENIESKKAVRMAFIYAVGMGFFRRVQQENGEKIIWVYDSGAGSYPVKKAGAVIGSGYTDLLDALYFNRKIKYDILKRAAQMQAEIRGFSDAEEMAERAEKSWFMDSLAGTADLAEGNPENILDILAGMLDKKNYPDGDALLEGLTLCLQDYLENLLDGDAGLMKSSYQKILEKLLAGSHIRENIEKAEAEGTYVPPVTARILRWYMRNLAQYGMNSYPSLYTMVIRC